MKFYMPEFNLPKLEKIVNKLSRKTDVKFEVFENTRRQTSITIDGVKYPYMEVEVELDLNYKMGDYELIAQLEHTPNGNIVRNINLEKQVPEKYRNTDCYCDHCHTNRDRKNTFLLLDPYGEYVQVGKTCLNDYTGYDSLSVAEAASSLYRIYKYAEMQNYDNDPEFLAFLKAQKDSYEPLEYIANRMYQLLSDKGYNKEDPFNGLTEYEYKEDLQPQVDELLNVVNTDWYDDSNDYCHNAKVVTSLEYIQPKHHKILMSYLYSAMKYLNKKKETNNLTNDYLGKVGDKIEFTVQSFKILFTGYDIYSGSDSYTYRFITETGHVVLWTTTKVLKDIEGCKIKGIIKSLKEYKGEKQTVITRARVDETNKPKPEPEEKIIYKGKEYNKNDADLGLDQFMDIVNDDDFDWDKFQKDLENKNESYSLRDAIKDLKED